ncbi:MAG: Wzz/FepE/Etk N-terminal domain-containing protein [Terracidiphilus sp.]|jgi:polysaccharide chain length determinant protein (PEP-CTERM system associated)
MLGHRDLTMDDYVGILKRRYKLILACTIVILAAAVAVSYVLPPRYMSQTLILIEQQRVPEDYVKPVVDEDLGGRLASMKEQILSRSRIEPIVTKFNLFAGGNATMDDRVDMVRKGIKITQIHSEQSRGMPGFFISFEAPDPHIAQQVCGEITSLFVSENLRGREQSAEGTSDFLRQQLADSKRNLDDQDAKLAAFEQKNLGKLPGQTLQLGNMSLAMGSPNESTLQALTTQLDATNQSLDRMQQNETFLEAMIAEQTRDLQGPESANVATVDERKRELQNLMEQKQTLQTLYTPDHPDVVAINHRIANLQAEMAHSSAAPAPAPQAPATTRPDTPQLQQLKMNLRSVKLSISEGRQEQTRLTQDIKAYEAKIEASPLVEEEYKQVTRDHETALEFYNSLLKKMNESSMATALEHRQQGEQFTIMDSPNLPDAPTYPNRTMFAVGGLAGGLFLGLLLTALLEYRDTSVRNERDIWAFTKLPTLAIISHVAGLPKPGKSHHKGWKFFSRTNKPVESAPS